MKEKRVVFKRYVQNQPTLLPASLEELVPERHPVRVVNEVLERIELSSANVVEGAAPEEDKTSARK